MASSYPGALDSFTPKVDDVDDVLANDVNELQDGIEAVQAELGTDPAKSYATVRALLDDDNQATVHAAIEKKTPVDADEFGFWDSVASALKKLTWANLKTTLASTFLPLAGGTMTGEIYTGGRGIASYTSGTVADDTAISFDVGPSIPGFLLTVTNASQYMWGRFIKSSGNGAAFVSDANTQLVNNTQLLGTTSTDGKLTISLYSTDGKIYVENRMGANRTFTILILG